MYMKTSMQRWCMPAKFDENSDLSTTYLGQAGMTRNTKIKAEDFPSLAKGLLQENY